MTLNWMPFGFQPYGAERGPASGGGGGGYSGPGDQVSGAVAWWGLRGYNAAYATGSNPAIDVVDTATGLITTSINIKSNGDLDDATILGLGYAVSVKKIYDQIGTKHLVQNTLSKMPTLIQNSINSFPAMIFVASSSQTLRYSGGAFSIASQPYTYSGVGMRSASTTVEFLSCSSAECDFLFTSANNIGLFSGSFSSNVSCTNSVYHSLQGVYNGSSSIIDVNGSSTSSLNPGTDKPTNSNISIGSYDDAIFYLDGGIFEAGIWASAFSGTDITNMSTNQKNYLGI